MSRLYHALTEGRKNIRRKKRINPVNRKRRAKRQAEQYGDKAKYVRSMPCDVCHKPGPSDPHHVPSKGAGGTSKDLLPLCRFHHQEFHTVGEETFNRTYGIVCRERTKLYESWFRMDPQPMGF